MGYKFDGNKYMTNGIEASLPVELKCFLWDRVLDLVKSGIEMDYLQVFTITKLESDSEIQAGIVVNINHQQEQPEEAAFEKEYYIILDEMDSDFEDCKIYIIDDRTHCTMLYASEY